MRPAQLRPVKNKNNNYKYIVLNIVAILVDDRVQIMTITTRTLANLTANKNTYKYAFVSHEGGFLSIFSICNKVYLQK